MTNIYIKCTRIILIALTVLLSSVTYAQDSAQELADKWTTAYNAFDKQALSELYTDNAHLYVDGSPMIIGRELIEAFWSNDFTVDNPKTVLIVTETVEGYDMVLVHGDYQVIDKKSDAILGSGKFTHIWHNVGGQWQLDQDIWHQPAEKK